ncbi:hypothetical protein OAT16_05285 [Prolixibacteraceae bacterium]|nr:hypothetical protein [Prolixibacteraceae bacterium]
MEYKINLPEMENADLKLTVPFWGKARIFLNDREIEKDNGVYKIFYGGNEASVTLKANFLDPVPTLLVNDKSLSLVEPIKWYEYVWSALPVILIFQGGFMGALLGITTFRFNTNVFRADKSVFMKYLLTLGLNLLCGIAFFAIVLFIETLRRS